MVKQSSQHSNPCVKESATKGCSYMTAHNSACGLIIKNKKKVGSTHPFMSLARDQQTCASLDFARLLITGNRFGLLFIGTKHSRLQFVTRSVLNLCVVCLLFPKYLALASKLHLYSHYTLHLVLTSSRALALRLFIRYACLFSARYSLAAFRTR